MQDKRYEDPAQKTRLLRDGVRQILRRRARAAWNVLWQSAFHAPAMVRCIDGKQQPMPRIHRVALERGITVDGQFEFIRRAPMARGFGAGTIREFDDCGGGTGRLRQVRDTHCAARIKMRVGNLDLNGIGHERGLQTLDGANARRSRSAQGTGSKNSTAWPNRNGVSP
jgi:hypothetical protein